MHSSEIIIHLSASICEIFEAGLDNDSHFRSSLLDLSENQISNISNEDLKKAFIRAIPDLINQMQMAIEDFKINEVL